VGLKKSEYVWMDGKFVPWDNAHVHALTHALHYGTGVFEGIRCYETARGPAVFRLKEHVARLFRSAKLYKMPMRHTQQEVAQAVKELVRRNDLKSCYIRPLSFHGYGNMGLTPLECPVQTILACWSWGNLLGDEGLKTGITAKVSSWRRISSNALPMQAKGSGQYLNSNIAKMEALQAGAQEAIMLNDAGFVAEGPGENIFAVKNGVLYAPPTSAGILDGITRASVIEMARSMGIEVREENFLPDFLHLADEAFFSGTAAEIMPIREIGGIEVGEGKPGPLTVRIQQKFFDTVKGKDAQFARWLDYIEEPQSARVAAAAMA
jgi:branched-chain amino acid aminotransferase